MLPSMGGKAGHGVRPLFVTLIALSACSEQPQPIPTEPTNVAAVNLIGAQPRGTLEQIGVGLAIALRDAGTRDWLLNGISKSPYVERRIPLRRILMADTSAKAREILLKAGRAFTPDQLHQLPDLELYLPIQSQRVAASSRTSFQVAVRTTADSFYIVRPNGTAFRVDEWYDPGAVVTVVLGPSEIDYDDAPSALLGGARTGTSMLAAMKAGIASGGAHGERLLPNGEVPHAKCDPEMQNCGGGGGGPSPPPTGGDTAFKTYMGYFYLTQNMEGILMGTQEIEIFGQVNGAYASCASATDLYPQTDYYWSATPGHVLATAIPVGSNLFTLQAYEDDDDRCVKRPGDDPLGNWSPGITIAQYNFARPTNTPSLALIKVHVQP